MLRMANKLLAEPLLLGRDRNGLGGAYAHNARLAASRGPSFLVDSVAEYVTQAAEGGKYLEVATFRGIRPPFQSMSLEWQSSGRRHLSVLYTLQASEQAVARLMQKQPDPLGVVPRTHSLVW